MAITISKGATPLDPRAASPQQRYRRGFASSERPGTRIGVMGVPIVFTLLLIAGVVVIGLLVAALVVMLMHSPDAPADG